MTLVLSGTMSQEKTGDGAETSFLQFYQQLIYKDIYYLKFIQKPSIE
jgi:hypothetical protein